MADNNFNPENFNLNDDFELSPEEIKAIDEVLFSLAESFEKNAGGDAIINPGRAKELIAAYKILTKITKGKKVKVTYTMNEPFISMGSVNIDGKDLTFDNPRLFREVIKLASNFNVYPKVNGEVHMDFTFHNLTISLDNGGN